MPKRAWRRGFLDEAVKRLYRRDRHLIDTKQEDPATTQLVGHLRQVLEDNGYLERFPAIHVNGPYARDGRDPKRDVKGRRVKPDLVVHVPGTNGPNIAVIEVKGHWNSEDRSKDVRKLKGYLTKQRYWRAYTLELFSDKHVIKRIKAD